MKLNLEALAVSSFDVGAPSQGDVITSCTPECNAPTNPYTILQPQQDTVLM
ncbi:MAG TPA: hypothetical protein VHG91_19355 [Longimicrobium sp.]|nr:hypothetical protein [Longimicrobium sp.]